MCLISCFLHLLKFSFFHSDNLFVLRLPISCFSQLSFCFLLTWFSSLFINVCPFLISFENAKPHYFYIMLILHYYFYVFLCDFFSYLLHLLVLFYGGRFPHLHRYFSFEKQSCACMSWGFVVTLVVPGLMLRFRIIAVQMSGFLTSIPNRPILVWPFSVLLGVS